MDQNGKLLTGRPTLLRAGLRRHQLEYVRLLEQGFIKRIDKSLRAPGEQGNFPGAGGGRRGLQPGRGRPRNHQAQPHPDQTIPQPTDQRAFSPQPGAQGVPGAPPTSPGAGPTADQTCRPGHPGNRGCLPTSLDPQHPGRCGRKQTARGEQSPRLTPTAARGRTNGRKGMEWNGRRNGMEMEYFRTNEME